MSAVRLAITAPPDDYRITRASVSLGTAPEFAALASNDRDPAQVIRDKISQAALAADDVPPADIPRKRFSVGELAGGAVGAAAIFVAIACLLAH